MADLRGGSTVGGKIIETEEGSIKKINKVLLELSNLGQGGSIVQPSTTNGNIKVNTAEVTVYDDTIIKNVLVGKANTIHTHAISNITNLQSFLDGKAEVGHTHSISGITGLQSALDNKAGLNHGHSLSNITDVDLTNKVNGYALLYNESSNKFVSTALPTLSLTASTTNGNIKVNGGELKVFDSTSIDLAMNGKANTIHNHTISDVENLQTGLDSKANLVHTHTLSNVTDVDLTSKVDGFALIYDAVTSKFVSKALPTSNSVTINSSTTNGNIKVNGVEFPVYNDSVLTSALAGKANITHVHAVSDILNLQTALDNKTDLNHVHMISGITNLQASLDAKANLAHNHTISNITDVDSTNKTNGYVLTYDTATSKFVSKALPVSVASVTTSTTNGNIKVNGSELAVYSDTAILSSLAGKAPTVHVHSISDVTNLQTSLNGKSDTGHTHTISNVTNLQTTLDGKASSVHLHAISDVTNLQATLTSKANSVHGHSISDVTSLQTALDSKSDTGHGHTISNITNLQSTLDGKAPVVHGHAISDITNLQTTLTGKSDVGHVHSIANVTNLQSTLDGKAALSHNHTLSNVTDVDVTNKTNGYALIYDTTASKFVSKALPVSGATNMGELSDVDVSTVVPSEGTILQFVGGKWKPTALYILTGVDGGDFLSDDSGTTYDGGSFL